jgi:hypothetical protein
MGMEIIDDNDSYCNDNDNKDELLEYYRIQTNIKEDDKE